MLQDAVYQKVAARDAAKAWKIVHKIDKLCDRHCDRILLEEILQRLPNITAITATSGYPFDGCGVDLKTAWKSMTVDEALTDIDHTDVLFRARKTTVARYTDILLSTSKSRLPIQKLALDPFPIDSLCTKDPDRPDVFDNESVIEFFDEESIDFVCVDPTKQLAFQSVVGGVQDLRIRVLGSFSEYRDASLAQAMGEFLGFMPHLRSLDLIFDLDWYITPTFRDDFKDSFYRNT